MIVGIILGLILFIFAVKKGIIDVTPFEPKLGWFSTNAKPLVLAAVIAVVVGCVLNYFLGTFFSFVIFCIACLVIYKISKSV